MPNMPLRSMGCSLTLLTRVLITFSVSILESSPLGITTDIWKDRGGSQSSSVSASSFIQTETSFVCCRNSQKDKTDSLQNQSTVAAVISSVTATCLQITYQQHPSGISTAVNVFWLLSLALSIACALWSQLASRWTVSAFHSLQAKWISDWILTIPIVLLSMSSLAFAWGLICLAFSVFPHTAIPIIMVIVTSVAALVCVLVGTWLYVEHPIKDWFEHRKGASGDIESSIDAAERRTMKTRAYRLLHPFKAIHSLTRNKAKPVASGNNDDGSVIKPVPERLPESLPIGESTQTLSDLY